MRNQQVNNIKSFFELDKLRVQNYEKLYALKSNAEPNPTNFFLYGIPFAVLGTYFLWDEIQRGPELIFFDLAFSLFAGTMCEAVRGISAKGKLEIEDTKLLKINGQLWDEECRNLAELQSGLNTDVTNYVSSKKSELAYQIIKDNIEKLMPSTSSYNKFLSNYNFYTDKVVANLPNEKTYYTFSKTAPTQTALEEIKELHHAFDQLLPYLEAAI